MRIDEDKIWAAYIKSRLVCEVVGSANNIKRFQKKYGWLDKDSDYIKIFNDFNQIQSKLSQKDIFKYKDYTDLMYTIQGHINQTIPNQKRYHNIQQAAKQDKDVDIILNNDIYLVLLIKTQDAAIKYGKGTKWCITYIDSSFVEDEGMTHFELYSKDNSIYYIFDRRKSSKNPYYKTCLLITNEGEYNWYSANNNFEDDGDPILTPPQEILNIFKTINN